MDKFKKGRPRIVCLCGSTKFKEEFLETEKSFTLRGWIVLTVGFFTHADNVVTPDQVKYMLDELHLYKIDLADLVLIINKDGYIGESTASEIAYAKASGKPIEYLEGA